MLRILASVLLLIVANSVRAEWVKVGEDEGSVVYVDPATLVKSGDVRRAWTLSNLKLARADNVVSYRTLDDFNCKEGRRRTVFRVTYAGPMATGKVLDSGQLMLYKFENVYPYSPGGWQFEYVCGL
jgi:surface-adhesin protein E